MANQSIDMQDGSEMAKTAFPSYTRIMPMRRLSRIVTVALFAMVLVYWRQTGGW